MPLGFADQKPYYMRTSYTATQVPILVFKYAIKSKTQRKGNREKEKEGERKRGGETDTQTHGETDIDWGCSCVILFLQLGVLLFHQPCVCLLDTTTGSRITFMLPFTILVYSIAWVLLRRLANWTCFISYIIMIHVEATVI